MAGWKKPGRQRTSLSARARPTGDWHAHDERGSTMQTRSGMMIALVMLVAVGYAGDSLNALVL
jgi:hypothetical protein